jgi:hypothetical protein
LHTAKKRRTAVALPLFPSLDLGFKSSTIGFFRVGGLFAVVVGNFNGRCSAKITVCPEFAGIYFAYNVFCHW